MGVMGQSPPWDGGPPNGSDSTRPEPPKGEFDALSDPSALKARKTVMGIAPAPHLGGTNRAPITDAEARKQRVLARLAAMDARGPQSLPGPSPARSMPPPGVHERPVEALPFHRSIPPPSSSSVPPPRTSVADAFVEVSEPAPSTARMLRPTAPANVQTAPTHPVIAPSAPTATLALRPFEPSGGRAQLSGRLALSGPIDQRLVLLNEPHSTRAASFRVLRDNLLTKSMPRVVAVTSAVPNDGKTTCAANLALALAEQPGTRVLLVDANFFSPDLSKAFEIDRLPPATPPDPAGWLAPYKLVEVMPSVHVAGIPASVGQDAKRFEHHRFDALIERFVQVSYDFVVIDAPALRGTPAVTQLLSTADGALLVVRSGGTTTRDLRRAAEQLPPKKALGIALMDAHL